MHTSTKLDPAITLSQHKTYTAQHNICIWHSTIYIYIYIWRSTINASIKRDEAITLAQHNIYIYIYIYIRHSTKYTSTKRDPATTLAQHNIQMQPSPGMHVQVFLTIASRARDAATWQPCAQSSIQPYSAMQPEPCKSTMR